MYPAHFLSEETVSINQDKYGGQNPDGHLVRCFYTANASEVEFTLTRVGSEDLGIYMHLVTTR